MRDVYDYIIVGGGAAGCVLANRLSARSDRRVLLLEAGPPDRNPFIHMPKGVGRVLGDPRYVWGFTAHGSPGSNRPPRVWPRGKTLGGSSSTNGMMYVRGQPRDFDTLAELAGEAWSWSHIARAYAEMETHPLGAAPSRGGSGPLKLSLPQRRQPTLERVIESARSVGLPLQTDVNIPDDAEKVGYCPQTVWRGRRQSAAKAFLDPVRSRRNLTIRTDVMADRVLIQDGRATGVDVRTEGGAHRFDGRRIILCAGALGSPAILERSGVGAGDRLRALGVDPKVESPDVGRNLYEHCAITLQWRLKAPISRNPQYGGWRLGLNVLRYVLTRTGPLAGATFDVGGWFKTHPDLDRPNAQFLAAPHSIDRSKAQMATEPFPGMQMVVYPLRPRARGEIHITSPDPDLLSSAYLDDYAHPEDRRELVDAVRYVRRLVEASPLAAVIETETRPGPAVSSDEEILDAYRVLGTPGYHAGGTCRMGGDAASVVDPLTRVRGVEGLHVVDLSIAPVMLAGNTAGPVMALAWRAAEVIGSL